MTYVVAEKHIGRNDVRVRLPLRLRELGALVDAEADEGVGTASAELRAFEVARALDRDLEHADGRVDGLAREHLLEVEREDVGVVHHRAEDAVDRVADER